MNISDIMQYLENLLEKHLGNIPFSVSILEENTPHICYTIVMNGTTFLFECTPLYVQIQMNATSSQKTFAWGNISVVKHYASAFIRLIQTFIIVSNFNEESKSANIDMEICLPNTLQYNLPEIRLKLFLNDEEKGFIMTRHLISEKYWIPPSDEGYPLPANPISADFFYYPSVSKGLQSISLTNFYDTCHQLVGKIHA